MRWGHFQKPSSATIVFSAKFKIFYILGSTHEIYRSFLYKRKATHSGVGGKKLSNDLAVTSWNISRPLIPGFYSITRKEYVGNSHILSLACIPTSRPLPSIMSFFLFERGFRPYVDHRWRASGSKDMDSNPIAYQVVFLLVFLSFFCLTKPRSNHKTHTTNPLTKNIRMPSPLRQVAWECGDCAATNRGREQLPCSSCRAVNPRRYEILAGSAPAATARTTYVMRSEQHVIVREALDGADSVIPCPVVD